MSDLVISAGYAVLGRWREKYDSFDHERARELLDELGAAHLAERRFGTLSEGERKRVLSNAQVLAFIAGLWARRPWLLTVTLAMLLTRRLERLGVGPLGFVCNDYAIRDYLENYYRPNLRVKSRDTLTPIGPWIVSKETIQDPHNLALRTWVKQAEIDGGDRPGTTTSEAERIAQLERENRELRRANTILKQASAFFAAEIDRPQR